jgi:hypothetical protein
MSAVPAADKIIRLLAAHFVHTGNCLSVMHCTQKKFNFAKNCSIIPSSKCMNIQIFSALQDSIWDF